MVKQTRKLNLIPDDNIVVIPVSQYDEGEDRLTFELYVNGVPYTPTGTVKIQGTKPSGAQFEHDVTFVGNVVTSDLHADMTDESGQTRSQIAVYEGDDRTGSQVFFLSVQKDAEGEI